MALPLWLKEKLFQKSLIQRTLKAQAPDYDWNGRLLFAEHHQSHAASAFYPSPYDEAVILTMDGVGEWATTSMGLGRGNHIEIMKEIHFPHSLGLLYSAFTYYLGFKVNSGEYKVMGLAPYGEPKHAQTILDKLIDLKDDGSYRLDLSYFDYCTGLRMTNERFDALFGRPPRGPEELLTQDHMDIAASLQKVTEEAVLRLARSAAQATGGQESLPCRRRGFELRRQRQGTAGGRLRRRLDPTGGGRCRRSFGRGALRLPSPQRPAARREQPARCDARLLSRPQL